jgi:hypothetical protein
LIRFPDGYRFCFGVVDHRYDIEKMSAGATMIDAVMLGVINETRAVNRVFNWRGPEEDDRTYETDC